MTKTNSEMVTTWKEEKSHKMEKDTSKTVWKKKDLRRSTLNKEMTVEERKIEIIFFFYYFVFKKVD